MIQLDLELIAVNGKSTYFKGITMDQATKIVEHHKGKLEDEYGTIAQDHDSQAGRYVEVKFKKSNRTFKSKWQPLGGFKTNNYKH